MMQGHVSRLAPHRTVAVVLIVLVAAVVAVVSTLGIDSASSTAASAPRQLPLGTPAGTVGPAAPQRLDAGWQRAADPADDGLQVGRQTGQGDGWVPVTVPDVADPALSLQSFRGGVWWYVRDVAVPAAAEGGTWALRFEAVRRIANVYVDGQLLASNDDPYAPFEVALPRATTGRTVRVAIRVDGRRPGGISEGWWNWAGLTRPVWLIPRGRLLTSDPAVQGTARCDAAGSCTPGVRVRATVLNRLPQPLAARARLTLADPSGKRVLTVERDLRTIGGGRTASVSIDASVPNGRLWSPSSPTLYRARLELLGGIDLRPEQVVDERIGLRSVAVTGAKLRLNGRELRLRGSSIQEDVPGRGAAMSDGDVQRIVDELQASGANVTRAHYTLDDRLLDALDRAGIMVWAQTPVYQADRRLREQRFFDYALRTNRASILATRNHPSVIVHSVANELTAGVDAQPASVAYLDQARRDAEALDPTVPPALDIRSLPDYPAQQAHARFPVLGLNAYFGWYKGPKAHRVDDFRRFVPFLDATRAAYPTQALAITEMGAEGIKSGKRTLKGTLQFQARYLARVMNVVDRRTDLSGALYWTLREFAVRPDWTGGADRRTVKRTGLHRKGLLTYAGRPKPVWGVARQRLDGALWSPAMPPRVRYGP